MTMKPEYARLVDKGGLTLLDGHIEDVWRKCQTLKAGKYAIDIDSVRVMFTVPQPSHVKLEYIGFDVGGEYVFMHPKGQATIGLREQSKAKSEAEPKSTSNSKSKATKRLRVIR